VELETNSMTDQRKYFQHVGHYTLTDYNKDDKGILIKSGQRCMMSHYVPTSGRYQETIMDRELANTVIEFLDKRQRETADG